MPWNAAQQAPSPCADEEGREDGRASLLQSDMVALARSVTVFASALSRPDRIPPLFRKPGFGALVQLILEQQVSVKAAQAMWRRLLSVVPADLPELTPDAVLALPDETLRQCGFSARKTEYVRGLADMVASGTINLAGLSLMPDDEVIDTLTSVRGIGSWTAECYLLWALGRRDVMPAGDLAIQVGLQELAGLADRPDTKTLKSIAETSWRPYRSAAALLLWRVYLDNRATDGSTLLAVETLQNSQPTSSPKAGNPI